MTMIREVIAVGVFAAVTDRSVRDKSWEKKSVQGRDQPTECDILLQDILDLSNDCDYKKDRVNK